ncbi:MAG: hypothetical protein U0L05_06825 [Schaedlerella sp.]|nr:hypothetical protein [Schaedlerella sp.]
MLQKVVTDTNIIYFFMILVASVGVLAKIVNHFTLRNLVKASGNMQKSTHKLIKLVRSKYEHACMLHDRVENVEAFVEKYIYEYQGVLFRIHTWRQLQIQTIWFEGILGFIGASCWYLEAGFCEGFYRYVGLGASAMVLLFVVSQFSDEQHKILRIRNYMVDYLENVCAFRHRKLRQAERERIEVIQTENGRGRTQQTETMTSKGRELESQTVREERDDEEQFVQSAREEKIVRSRRFAQEEGQAMRKQGKEMEREDYDEDRELSIRIEGEPRKAGRRELAKKVFGKQERETEESHSSVQEETLRKILEEFLAE